MDVGFGWSFYGFFVAAGLWIAAYFLWAWHAARHDRNGSQGGHGR